MKFSKGDVVGVHAETPEGTSTLWIADILKVSKKSVQVIWMERHSAGLYVLLDIAGGRKSFVGTVNPANLIYTFKGIKASPEDSSVIGTINALEMERAQRALAEEDKRTGRS